MASEVENNLVLGVAARLRNDSATGGGACYWVTIEEGDAVVGCAFRTPPYQLSMTAMPKEAAAVLARQVYQDCGRIPGVAGPATDATRFAEEWAARTGDDWEIRIGLRIHRLTAVVMPRARPKGRLRQPAPEEMDLVREWVTGFGAETGMPTDPRELTDRLRAAGQLFVWDDDGPRCMIAAVRETPRGVCINTVYTPAEYREKGYASIAVATLCQDLLAQGRSFCCLYTDTANPTSNSIYRRIGFTPVREDVHIDFRRQPTVRAT